ncbi:MAG: HEAT repeat domain-containing protein [Thermoguttaceae bacterium]|nr:HEAT repeat domain-containing protein [Thermoguttaceae bacterium]
MNLNWKKYALLAAALVATPAFASTSFAQEAAAKLAEFAPKMTAQNMADGGQVGEMEKAQQGWMNYVLETASDKPETRAEANKAALEALAGDYPVVTKAWLLHVLQWTADETCVDAIAPFLANEDARLVDAASRALAEIPGDAALKALEKARDAAEGDKKAAFEHFIKSRSVDCSPAVETETIQSLPYVSDAKFAEFMSGFDKLSDDDKARALGALRVRKAKDFVDVAVKALKSESVEVKRAAILALEKIATGKEFDVLYEQMKTFDRGFVADAMKRIPGADFDAAVAAALKKETNGDNAATLADVVSARYLVSEVSSLLDSAKKGDCPIRLQLLTAAERLATKEHIGDFVDAFVAIPAGGDRDRAEQIIARLCEGDATPVIAKMNNANGATIFPLLGRIGGDAAFAQIERGLKSGNAAMIALSVRSLCNWPNAKVASQLLDAAKNGAYPENMRIQALRAYIRVVSLPDDQDAVDMSGADKLAALKDAFKLATRDDERNLALERVGSVRELDSVKFALEHVDNKALQNKALNAVLDLAHQDFLRKKDKDLFTKALDVVLEKGDQGQKDRAGRYKAAMK